MSEPDDDMFSLPSLGKDFDLQTARLVSALMSQELKNQRQTFLDFKNEVRKDYALKSDVRLPIKLVYSTAAAVLLAFVAALVSLVMKGHSP